MRLFTGISLPSEVAALMDRLIAELKPLAKVRWSPAANLHITTKFIGEWPESRLEEMIQQLGFPHGPVPITLEGLGFFPKIFWAGVRAAPELMSLAAATESALERIGVKPEPRAYSPHLTVARIPSPARLSALRARSEFEPFAEFEASEFHLYQSEGSVYQKLATFALE